MHYRDRPLPIDLFERQATDLHYALFLRDEPDARGVPSGSFFDAVKVGRPYLSLGSAFVRHYHARFPDTGELCADIPKMAAAIQWIVTEAEQGNERYRRRLAALAALREALSVERIARSFQEQLER